MKKISSLIVWLNLLLFFSGCQKEFIEPDAERQTSEILAVKKGEDPYTCPEYFYYSYKDKISLGTVQTNQIVLGFQPGTTRAQKEAFISRYSFLDSIKTEYNTGSADATIVTLAGNISCNEALSFLTLLEEQTEIQYATPFFNQNGQLLGITNQFIVTIKQNASLADLQNLVNKTGTRIVDQYSDYTFVLSADKKSNGDALEMANYFARSAKVETAEPDFLYDFGAL